MTERTMASTEANRRGFLRGAAAVAVTAAVGALAPRAAHAVDDPPPGDLGALLGGLIGVPPIGTEFPCSMYAADVPLKLTALGALTLYFVGGIYLTARTSEADGLAIEARGFKMVADTNPSTPHDGTTITLTQSDVPSTPLGVVKYDGESLIHLSLTATILDKATGVETVVGSTSPANYATLKSASGQFPPANARWTLKEPVTLYAPGGSGEQNAAAVGVLEEFNADVNHSEWQPA